MLSTFTATGFYCTCGNRWRTATAGLLNQPSKRFHALPAPGFTLIELVIVVSIIAIITALALPAYSTYVTRSQLTEAHNGLTNYYVQMEQYFQDNRSYGAGAACGVMPSPPGSPDAKYFAITCTLNSTTSYTATANGFSGRAQGFAFTIDQSNKRITTMVPSKSGWSLPTQDCWITNKGGVCS